MSIFGFTQCANQTFAEETNLIARFQRKTAVRAPQTKDNN